MMWKGDQKPENGAVSTGYAWRGGRFLLEDRRVKKQVLLTVFPVSDINKDVFVRILWKKSSTG